MRKERESERPLNFKARSKSGSKPIDPRTTLIPMYSTTLISVCLTAVTATRTWRRSEVDLLGSSVVLREKNPEPRRTPEHTKSAVCSSVLFVYLHHQS